MVKALVALTLLFCITLFADQENNYLQNEELGTIEDVVIVEDRLTTKIKDFLDEKSFEENRDFINVIFDPKSSFYKNERVDAVKVIQTLKENGHLKLNFKTSGTPLFFIKIMGDTLRNIGYFRYVTTASHLDSSEFEWKISLTSEYATDPLVLEKELNKNGCRIIDIERNSATEWSYVIDMSEGFLNINQLQNGEEFSLKRSLYAHWFNVSQIKSLRIKSGRRNSWYPYIAYYDSSLHLLQVIKKDKIFHNLNLNLPQNAKYIKISDLYTLKNVRDSLLLIPSGSK